MNAVDISPYIIAKSNLVGDGITNKKLQKLLYYVKAWGLVYFADGIIDDDFEAWVHGPVCPSVYFKYKDFKFHRINESMSEDDAIVIVDNFRKEQLQNGLCPDKLDLIDAVFDKYGQMTSLQLELLSHQEEPWLEARKGLGPTETGHSVINPETMRRFYGKTVQV